MLCVHKIAGLEERAQGEFTVSSIRPKHAWRPSFGQGQSQVLSVGWWGYSLHPCLSAGQRRWGRHTHAWGTPPLRQTRSLYPIPWVGTLRHKGTDRPHGTRITPRDLGLRSFKLQRPMGVLRRGDPFQA